MPQPPKSRATSEEDKPTTAQEKAAEAPPTPAEDEQAFRVDEITRYLVPKGYRHHDVAGAFSGVSGAKRITVANAAKRVKSWLRADQLDDNDLTD